MPNIAQRSSQNPLLQPSDGQPSRSDMEVECLLNPGVFRFDGFTWLIVRVAERPKQVDGHSFRCLLTGSTADWKRTEAFSCFNYMNNLPVINEAVGTYTPDLASTVDQYRPSRALNSTRFSYVWNGWADGSTKLPRTMLGEYHHLLGTFASEQKLYAEHIRFIEYRTPEELYDAINDPGNQNNLANDPTFRAVIDGFRERMEALLAATNDHELENYQQFRQVDPRPLSR